MKRRIVLFTTILVLVVNAICVGKTFSWFTITDGITADYFKTGKLDYKMYGDFIGTGAVGEIVLIVPGDHLLKPVTPATTPISYLPIYLSNNSTVNSSVKISVHCTVSDVDVNGNPINTISADDIVTVTIPTTWIRTSDTAVREWIYTPSGSDIVPPPTTFPTTEKINVISDIMLSTAVSQAHAGKLLNIKIKFYARQADNVTWSQIQNTDYEAIINTP
ncbi:MAG: hypothetical protein RR436_07210 [Clostridia bacterium]